MSTGSSLVELKQAVVAALAARPGLSGVQVTYAYPVANVTGEDIWLANAEGTLTIPTMRAGTKRVEESYDLLVVAQVLKTAGEGQEAADLRAVAVLAEIQQCFAETPQLIPLILWAQVTGWQHSTGSYGGEEASCGSRFEITVNVRARLSPI